MWIVQREPRSARLVDWRSYARTQNARCRGESRAETSHDLRPGKARVVSVVHQARFSLERMVRESSGRLAAGARRRRPRRSLAPPVVRAAAIAWHPPQYARGRPTAAGIRVKAAPMRARNPATPKLLRLAKPKRVAPAPPEA